MGLMALYLGLLLLLLFVFESFPQESVCVRLPDIYWNATNPIFRIDNTDHIIDVNRDNLPYDQVNIICPVYAPGTKEEDAEKYIIYNVSKEEYDTCRITNPNPRIIAVCDKPYKLMYFTITFRSFTPQPGGLEFRPGQDYYFISTSSRDDLHRRVGGRCSSENMKVVFKVCCQAGDSPSQQTTTGAPALPSGPRLPASTPRSSSSGTTTMIVRRPSIVYPSTSATTSSTTLPSVIRSYYPVTRPPPSKNYNNNANVESTTKRRKGSEKHNEVVKNEELTSGGVRSGGGGLTSSIPRWTPHLAALLLVLITIANPFWRVR